jgi:L-lactate dehydrogenase complex protein LldG
LNTSRVEILKKIRLALAKPATEALSEPSVRNPENQRLFVAPPRYDSLRARFQEEFERVSGELLLCSHESAALDSIRGFIEKEGFQSVVVSQHEICQRLKLVERLSAALPQVRFLAEHIDSEDSYERAQLKEQIARVPLSITGVDYLIADTGTLVTIAHPQASRQISLLPTVHMVLATPDQIRSNMIELIEEIQQKYGESLPGSAITLITGPSRTADIEKVLIKGVHGPTRLVAMIVEEPN